jgi:hypothetical protein
MSRYYTKTALTIPESNQVFITKHIEKVDQKFKDYPVDKLKQALLVIHKKENLSVFRLCLFSISKALSLHGIAPRWQGLEDACVTDDQLNALTIDAPIIDLFWLALTFPKHKTINKRWQSIFTNGFGLELALSILDRQIHTAKKIRCNLNLTRFEQIGCLHFLTKSQFKTNGDLSTLTFIEAAKKRSRTAYNREIERCDTMLQMSPEIAHKRHMIYLSWLLSEESPTKATKVYKWMTGMNQDRANIARTIKRMEAPSSRMHIM